MHSVLGCLTRVASHVTGLRRMCDHRRRERVSGGSAPVQGGALHRFDLGFGVTGLFVVHAERGRSLVLGQGAMRRRTKARPGWPRAVKPAKDPPLSPQRRSSHAREATRSGGLNCLRPWPKRTDSWILCTPLPRLFRLDQPITSRPSRPIAQNIEFLEESLVNWT